MPAPKLDLHLWFEPLLAAAVAVLVGLAIYYAARPVLRRIAQHSGVLAAVLRSMETAALFALPLVGLQLVWHAAPDDLRWIGGVRHASGVLLLAVLTWLLLRVVRGVADGVIHTHPTNTVDNVDARRVHTQARVLSRIVMMAVVVTGLSMILMTFPGARQVGASLLASAGVIGVVVGIAARPIFSNLIAGLQIALAQPIRIDDVLIVQGEWGRVGEITGTYVVLHIWDERRLIIPLQWFIENPFQNWTRTTADLTGTVFLWVDYAMPLEPLRAELRRLCEASVLWDGRQCLLQVTEAGESAVQLRALVSASDATRAWDLRCEVREGLVSFMQRGYPQHLPLRRVNVAGDALTRGEPALRNGPAATP
jgi:small-conductance mechanosensitive channel